MHRILKNELKRVEKLCKFNQVHFRYKKKYIWNTHKKHNTNVLHDHVLNRIIKISCKLCLCCCLGMIQKSYFFFQSDKLAKLLCLCWICKKKFDSNYFSQCLLLSLFKQILINHFRYTFFFINENTQRTQY